MKCNPVSRTGSASCGDGRSGKGGKVEGNAAETHLNVEHELLQRNQIHFGQVGERHAVHVDDDHVAGGDAVLHEPHVSDHGEQLHRVDVVELRRVEIGEFAEHNAVAVRREVQ